MPSTGGGPAPTPPVTLPGPGGGLPLPGGAGAGAGSDLDPAATPELGSLALFGTGATGMAGYLFARVRRKR
ncbi:MAG TPA: hypothetical protein VNK05_06980 [Chloroflexota bacterium]|nr:hypothetical protein [Chloroflexota bacterium]